MRDELVTLKKAIEEAQLPPNAVEFIGPLWSVEEERFHVQETYIVDYKEEVPRKFSDDYGIGIIRLCIAFHNTFGGIVIFGIKDRELTVTGTPYPLDVESINRVLSDVSGFRSECIGKSYKLDMRDGIKTIFILLIPKRGMVPPIRLTKPQSRYPLNTLWIRDRAEVLEAKSRHYPLLYSKRTQLPSDVIEESRTPVHRSLPPSPATMKTFIGREKLLTTLWDWLVFGDQPRLYLNGPGGSGKSTLAFEFARLLTEVAQDVSFPGGDKLDYVIFISGKETELNPQTGKEQIFKMQQFGSAHEQFAQIAYHSGLLDENVLIEANEGQVNDMLDELFSNFNGLIVVDDIDALHRKAAESGEETLLMKSFRAKMRTRILYTLRFAPANAGKSAIPVPGLDEDEYYDFTEACCRQYDIKPPDGQYLPTILEQTKALPLLIETVVHLRKFCGSYNEALSTFAARGGDDARRYLYQREYDRLEKGGKSRQLLAGLALFDDPLGFSTLCKLFSFAPEQVRDALAESTSVFLATVEDTQSGETLYQLTPPSAPFVLRVSQDLTYFGSLQRTVNYFKNVKTNLSPGEAALVVSMERLIRQKGYLEIVKIGESLPPDDPVLINPRVRAFLGQACSELGPDYREKAREWFRAAEGLNYRDVFMMRSWYNLELASGYGVGEAERICNVMLKERQLGARFKSEFLNKRGRSLYQQAGALASVNREKNVGLLKRAMEAYFESLWVGASGQDIEFDQTLSYMEKPLQKIMGLAHEDAAHVFEIIELLAEKKHDVNLRGIQLYFKYLYTAPIPIRQKNINNKIKGYCTKSVKKINNTLKPLSQYPGFQYAVSKMDELRVNLAAIE